jgi:hypothetical protein
VGETRREFTDPDRSLDDLAAVERLRASLAARVRSGLGGGTWADAGESHWLVMPVLRRVVETRPAFGVGFFGQAREDVDHAPILDLEQDVVARAARLPGTLAYYNVHFATGQWGNLVLFTTQEEAGRVRSDPRHLDALERVADHYRSVRLHRLVFPDGAVGETAPELESTLLIDFSETPAWRAVRPGQR